MKVNAPRLATVLRMGQWKRGTAVLTGGAIVAMAITYGAQIILTRIFDASSFGIADSFVSLVAILTSFASLRYEDAIMLPETDREASAVMGAAVALLLTTCVLLLGAVLLFGTWIGDTLGSQLLTPYLILVPLALLVHRANELQELWLSRARSFGRVGSVQVVRSSVTAGVRLTAGAAGLAADAAGLIWGFIAGLAGSAAFLRAGSPTRRTSDRPTFADIGQALVRYRRFPLFTMPANLLGALNTRLPFLLFLYFYSAEVVGYFGRAFVAVAIPLSLIGTAISRVFFVAASESIRTGGVTALTTKVHDRLVALAVLPVAAILVAGPELFEAVFGPAWPEAGRYASYLVVWFAIAGISSPLTRLFDVKERQPVDLLISLATFVLLAAALILTGRIHDIDLTLLLVGLAGAAARTVQLATLLAIARVRLLDALVPYLRYGLFVIPLAVGIYLTRGSGSVILLTTLSVGAILYGSLCLLSAYRATPDTQETPTDSKN